MPYLSITTSKTLTPNEKEALKSRAGELIALIPGKSESVTMITIDDSKAMYFRGETCDCAYINVKLYKESPFEAKKAFAESFTKAVTEETGIQSGDIFLNYSEYENWASGGSFR